MMRKLQNGEKNNVGNCGFSKENVIMTQTLVRRALIWLIVEVSYGLCCGQAEYRTATGECCPMCGKGLVVLRDCAEYSSTTCIPCIEGTFMNKPNGLNKCRTCKTCDEEQGLYTLKECTTASDAFCDVLDKRYCQEFSDGGECTFAERHTNCAPGQVTKTAGTRNADTVCEDCVSGFYSQFGINCTAWTDCTVTNKVKVEEGSLTRDVQCIEKRGRVGLGIALAVFAAAAITIALLGIYSTIRPATVKDSSIPSRTDAVAPTCVVDAKISRNEEITNIHQTETIIQQFPVQETTPHTHHA